MKRMKYYSAVLFSVLSLFLLLCLTGCPDEPEDDYSISEITVYNIPAQIPVFGDSSAPKAQTFKVYLNASNSDKEDVAPAAQGIVKASEGTLEANNTYTVTIQLRKPIVNLKIINGSPNPDYDPTLDPNDDLGPWSGTASYFSVMISPNDVTAHKVKAIWIKGGTTLNKGKKRCDWNSLMNFRSIMENDPEDEAQFAVKTQALYDDIICRDPDINSPLLPL